MSSTELPTNVTIRRGEAYRAFRALQIVLALKRLPWKVKEVAAKNRRRLKSLVQDYDETEMELLEQFADLDEHGNPQVSQQTGGIEFMDLGSKKSYLNAKKDFDREKVNLRLYTLPEKSLALFEDLDYDPSSKREDAPDGLAANWLEDLLWMFSFEDEEDEPAQDSRKDRIAELTGANGHEEETAEAA